MAGVPLLVPAPAFYTKLKNGFSMTDRDVLAFVEAIEHEQRRSDTRELLEIMRRATEAEPAMWGDTIIGFDRYGYQYDSGRTGESFVAGFSPRKQKLVVYITNGFKDYGAFLEKLGKHKSSVSCLYINKLADVDADILERLISQSYQDMKKQAHNAPTRA